MGQLADLFKEAREQKNISLEQVSEDTKIKIQFLEAIEAEDFEQFPSVPMARGFVKNYCRYLDLAFSDVETLLNNIDLGRNFKAVRKQQKLAEISLANSTKPRSFFNIDAFISLLIIVALLGSAGFFVYTQYLEPAETQAAYTPEPVEFSQAEAPSPIKINTPVILPTPTPSPTNTPAPTPTPSPQYYTGVTIELLMHERSWIQVLVDDKKVFEGNLEAGEKPNWVGEKRVAIRAGNGGGVEVFVNGNSMGLMGAAGEVIDQVWEKQDAPPIETPSPEATETPTS